MSRITVTLNKSIKLYDEASTSAEVCLSVISTEGVPAEIFVNKYDPFKGSYKFQHTAYYDELESVSDTCTNAKVACDVRTATAEYKALSLDKANTWIEEVCSDVRRLLNQYKFFTDDSNADTSVILITQNTVTDNAESNFEGGITMGGVEVEF